MERVCVCVLGFGQVRKETGLKIPKLCTLQDKAAPFRARTCVLCGGLCPSDYYPENQRDAVHRPTPVVQEPWGTKGV